MNEINLRTVDLNLLTVFKAIYDFGQVTKAAETLGLTQPAVSHALKRLRELFDDKLFTRVKARMVPTPLAHELSGPVGEILGRIQGLIGGGIAFDPAAAGRTVRIGMLDYGIGYFATRLVELLLDEAPGLTTDFRHTEAEAALAMVEDGELDIAIGPFGAVPGTCRKSLLVRDHCIVAVRAGHPVIKRKPTSEQFCRLGHVRFANLAGIDQQIDEQLAREGMARRTVMVVPHFSSALFAVSTTDLITTITRGPAELYKEFLGLKLYASPFELPSNETSAIRHQRTANDPLIDWLWIPLRKGDSQWVCDVIQCGHQPLEASMSGKGQLGFAEAFVSPGLGSNRKLDRLDALIDWSPLERLASAVRPGRRGRPPYAPLSMLKALYLQVLYDLSDPGLEEALLDRLSFRRFCGFALDGGTPDETTICRFRGDAGGVLEAAFEEINRQLEAAGLIVRKGTLMDATLVSAASRPPPYKAGAGAGHAGEPGADWTRKKGRAFFGYKAHLGVDQGSGLIRRVVLTSAKTSESEVADRLICGDEAAVYGDKAYEQAARRARLKAAGIKDRIMHRRHKHIAALPHWQQRRNALIARRRAPVEAVFSALKRLYGLRRAKSRSRDRNTARLFAAAAVYNMRRACLLAGP